MEINKKKVYLFLAITFFICWSGAGLFKLSGLEWKSTQAIIFAIIYMFIPALATVIVQKYIYREKIREPLGISFKLNPWFAAALLIPPVFALLSFLAGLLIPGIEYSPGMEGILETLKGTVPPERLQEMTDQLKSLPIHPIWLLFIQALIAGATVNAVAAFGEELGWRGFLQKELGPMGFWKSSLLIGAIWGLWHAPLILQGHNYPQHPVEGVFMMILWCTLLGPIISYLAIKANSVIAAAVFHGSLNASGGIALMLIKGGSDLTAGMTGAAGIAVLALLNLSLFIYNNNLSRSPVK